MANIAIWGGVGFNMLVMFTALRAVPPELYDAARVDGCSEVQLALRIKIPMIAPALVMTGVFSLIATLQVFSEPMTLEPLSNVLQSTWVPLMKIYSDAFVATTSTPPRRRRWSSPPSRWRCRPSCCGSLQSRAFREGE